MTNEDWILMAENWKEFSRSRGFTDSDIQEYEKWLVLSGQQDELEGAINDPWRRSITNYSRVIYLRHIEKAIADGVQLLDRVKESYDAAKLESKVVGKRSRTRVFTDVNDDTINQSNDFEKNSDINSNDSLW